MKTKLLLLSIFIVALLASCRKDRICTCTSIGSTTTTTVTYTKITKSEAKDACLEKHSVGTANTTCTLN